MECSKVFLKLERRVELLKVSAAYGVSRHSSCRLMLLTSLRGTRGGPVAISDALVPGCMRRLEFASSTDCSISVAWRLAGAPPEGEFGLIWISAGGGGLGRRGELGASAIVKQRRDAASRFDCSQW